MSPRVSCTACSCSIQRSLHLQAPWRHNLRETHLTPYSLSSSILQVREAQLAQYNYILVVGEAEKTAQTVNVRTRDNVVHGMFSLKDVKELMVQERNSRSRDSALSGKGQKPAAADGAAEADA